MGTCARIMLPAVEIAIQLPLLVAPLPFVTSLDEQPQHSRERTASIYTQRSNPPETKLHRARELRERSAERAVPRWRVPPTPQPQSRIRPTVSCERKKKVAALGDKIIGLRAR